MQSKPPPLIFHYKFRSRISSFEGRGTMHVKFGNHQQHHKPMLTISKKRILILSLLFVTSALILLSTTIFQPGPLPPLLHHHHHHLNHVSATLTTHDDDYPEWFSILLTQTGKRRLKIGLVNTELLTSQNQLPKELAELVKVEFDRPGPGLDWSVLFPEWINEKKPKCPELPMPDFGSFRGLDVVVAKVPCDGSNVVNATRKGLRDVFRVQVNLVVANLVVKSGGGPVYVVFLGGCDPMLEIFRCDDLVWKKGDSMVYSPNVNKLRHKVLMPVGSCDLARPFKHIDESGKSEQANTFTPSEESESKAMKPYHRPKEAYVTMLHSSEDYVCGAIALAQSILRTNTTKDLVLLADTTISPRSIKGLSDAGWKIKLIKRIKSPSAKPNAYNLWNYSKLRVWQLTDYDKVMFIDADFILLHNLDHFFSYPQLSAAANNRWIFNSGIMIVEPSECMFDKLMQKRLELDSYNGGDQGFLNEAFTWWHRLTIKLNYLKFFMKPTESRDVPNDRLTIHFLGFKPWVCYKDYDCNWDKPARHKFASNAAHKRWWEVYDAMPKRLQGFCEMSQQMDKRIKQWREVAKKNKHPDGHWKIVLKDPRHRHFRTR